MPSTKPFKDQIVTKQKGLTSHCHSCNQLTFTSLPLQKPIRGRAGENKNKWETSLKIQQPIIDKLPSNQSSALVFNNQ